MVRASLTRRGFLAALAATASVPLLLAACGRQTPQPKFNATDITGVDWARGFELADHAGRRRSLSDFRGKVVMLFFGYTSCPDACPLALAEMAEAVRRLGPDGARVQGLFVTVDPQRDTEKVLSSYVTAFHPAFLGLRGTPGETERLAKEFKIHYRADKAHASHGEHYMVDHSTGILVFDARGEPRLYISQNGRSIERIVEDLERLLASSEKETL
ncbi:MAG: SCO family protein [Woeseiaceae bacterium]